MESAKPPPTLKRVYNQSLSGFIGRFGTGAHAQIFFLQSALELSALDKVALISDIQGSEKWPVRDLFQREVDQRRVSEKLIPYLMDGSKLKFFNPLTLTMLPVDPHSAKLLADLHEIPETKFVDGSGSWTTLELPDYFRFRFLDGNPQYGVAEWNDERVRIVAIDGQHRLSALKRIKADTTGSSAGVSDWTIPVVLFGVRALDKSSAHQRILDVVRNIFVYINTEARPPSVTRQILLSDESINAVCAQEILDRSHSNDLLEPAKRTRTVMPLMFFDWRGVEEGGKEKPSPAAVKSIQEIRDWLQYYILGEDFGLDQEVALGVVPTDKLKAAFKADKLAPDMAIEVRDTFRKRVLPAIAYLLEHFEPYANYIKQLRDLEDELMEQSDVARYAFHKIRFGDDRAPPKLVLQVKEMEKRVLVNLTDAKLECFSELVRHDLGLRGVMCAFGDLRKSLKTYFADVDAGWMDYSTWFTKQLNLLFQTNILKHVNDGAPPLLKHICYTHEDSVTNYRLEHAENALGSFVALFVLAIGMKDKGSVKIKATDYASLRDDLLDQLQSTLFSGFKKEVRPGLKLEFPNGGKKLTEAVNEKATKLAEKQITKIRLRAEDLSGH